MSKTQSKRTDPYYVAQDILSRRDHSVREVRTKLGRKGFTAEQIDSVIAWLQQKRLLNDVVFAERYVATTLAAKAVGRRWLAYKLKEKGIAAEVATAALDAAFADDQEVALVKRAAAAWQRTHTNHASDRNRLTRYLLSRGFSLDTISRLP